ncbi:peptidase M20 [Paenibacillus odorifer]|nr:peptidase M20 [Paenibacillus odorifer]
MEMSRTIFSVNEKRLIEDFFEICKVDAPSQFEQPMADYLIEALGQKGFTFQIDEAHKEIGGECGNLIAYWEGTDSSIPPLFFSAHMDTVWSTKGLQPVIKDGVIYSDGTTILGADDRCAIAGYLEAINTIQENGISCGPIELILTVSEQRGLKGAHALDITKVKSKEGYVFDCNGDVGQIILQGGNSTRIHFDIETGEPQSGHFVLNPEAVNALVIAADGLKTMKLGIINSETNANIGILQGGDMTSIVPGTVEMIGEVRSFNRTDLSEQLKHMKEAVEQAAKSHGGDAKVSIDDRYVGFKIEEDDFIAKTAITSAVQIGVVPDITRTLGGADTNALNEIGLKCITLGNGFRQIHTFQENVSVSNVVNTARLTLAIIQNWYESQKK